MGNILSGVAIGMFIYVTDVVLRTFAVNGGFMELFKFTLQGILTYYFVKALGDFEQKRDYGV